MPESIRNIFGNNFIIKDKAESLIFKCIVSYVFGFDVIVAIIEFISMKKREKYSISIHEKDLLLFHYRNQKMNHFHLRQVWNMRTIFLNVMK